MGDSSFPITALTWNSATGATFQQFSEQKMARDTFTLNPRFGVAIDLWKKGVLRMAYQSRSTPGYIGGLAPVDTSGLIPPTLDIAFNRADDVEGSIEYELTRRTFLKGLLGYQKLSDQTTPGNNGKAQLLYGRVAVNQILGQNFSVFCKVPLQREPLS